jgi:NADPH:quinone reductase-like Zn-dependent oxidoreductase/NAD(P)-dependent dehydrogenase (short-subunit alcohol dehydrogenase family)
MAIHQRPTVNVIELVQGFEKLPHTVMSRLPRGVIFSTQVRYAVVDGGSDNDPATDIDDDIFGQPFALGALDAPLPADIASADLFLISHQVSNDLKEGLDSILERLIHMAKPGAVVVIAAPAAASNIEEIALPTLKAKGFELVSCMPAGAECLVLYKHTGSNEKQRPEKLTNGTPREEVSILEPITSSPEAQLLSKKLQDILKDHGYSVATKTGVVNTDAVDGKTYISLLELEKPMLENLSEPDFQSIRRLMVSCERLLWITCGDNPSFGIVDGLARCVNGEVAGAKFQVLHLSSEGMQHGPSLAVRILRSSYTTADNEFREQGGLLQVQRIYKSPRENNHIRKHLEDSTQVISLNDDSARFRLTIGKPGLLDSLHFVRDESALVTPLADHELELQVKATGVNFRDVMASMGLVPVTGLGQEASGVVLRTGSRAAKSFKLGDRVSTVSMGGTHATKTRCDFRVTAKIPDTMSFEEGAAAPMVHATAYYALVRLAKLRRGQSVLIHAAAGGVGQAAVQLATHLGLVVYVTVGTEDKRRFVMEQYGITEEHIFNSRDSSFAKGIQRVTGGRGVDCVLNSLSGELLRVSWNCLATFGTFVEIGLRDITDNMRLDMRPFGKSATFTFLDIPTLNDEDPAALGKALNDVFKLLHEGILHVPYPMTVYPVGQVEDAFRIMQQGKHRGKIVLSFSEEDKAAAPVLCQAKDSLKLDPDATFLFIGGLGGLGRSLAREFVASGARHIAFVSRSGDTKPEAKSIVDELTAHGAQVKVFCGDVADQVSFLAAMEQCSQQLPPIKGVIQMAMVLRDVVVEKMSYEEWTIPLRPKVQGTWNLHQYFGHERPLDFMIFCSSISGVCGNPGQAQYDAGNSYQDALARYRRGQGLKAVSINLGIMLDVGVIAESVAHNFKVWEEILGIREPAFHALMKSVINGQQRRRGDDEGCPAQVCIGLGTADILATHRLPSPPWFEDPRFGPLAVASAVSSASTGGEGAAAPSLASSLTEVGNDKDHAAAANIITGALVRKTAEILRIPLSEVDSSRPMYSYGVDSLVALEVRNWITREMKANMALLDIVAAVPMETFAGQIARSSKLVVGLAPE